MAQRSRGRRSAQDWRNDQAPGNDLDEIRDKIRRDEQDYREQFERYERDPEHEYPPRREIDVPEILPDGSRRDWRRIGRDR